MHLLNITNFRVFGEIICQLVFSSFSPVLFSFQPPLPKTKMTGQYTVCFKFCVITGQESYTLHPQWLFHSNVTYCTNIANVPVVFYFPDASFQKEFLEAHNTYRAKHNTPPLTLNSELTAAAQKWADHLLATGALAHSVTNDGENVFSMFSSSNLTLTGELKTHPLFFFQSFIKSFFSLHQNVPTMYFLYSFRRNKSLQELFIKC